MVTTTNRRVINDNMSNVEIETGWSTTYEITSIISSDLLIFRFYGPYGLYSNFPLKLDMLHSTTCPIHYHTCMNKSALTYIYHKQASSDL